MTNNAINNDRVNNVINPRKRMFSENNARAEANTARAQQSAKQAGKNQPAITVYDATVVEMTNILDIHVGRNHFVIKVVRKGVLSVRIQGLENFIKARNLLKERNYRFHTHTPKQHLPYSVLADGLCAEYTPEDVKRYLEGLDFQIEVISAINIGAKKWIIRLTRTTEVNKLYKIRKVIACDVTFRKAKGRECSASTAKNLDMFQQTAT